MNKHILYIILLFCNFTMLMAQNNAIFNSGNADGFDKDNQTQTAPISVDFSGGNYDGFAIACDTQTITSFTNFNGGINDGFAINCYQQADPNTVTFGGGNGDGHNMHCFEQISNANNIFGGGIGGDGQLNGCANEPLGCALIVDLGIDQTFCYGQTLTLDAGSYPGGATYLWQDGSTNQTLVVNTSGIYYVNVIDTAGCSDVDSIVITTTVVPIVNLGNDTAFCAGNSLVLDAGNSGATYQWQNGMTSPYFNQTFTAATTGMYFVNVSNGTCTVSDTINITVHPIVTTNLTALEICQNDSALIFGNYETVAGIYKDTLTATTGCDSILAQQLIVHPNYNIVLSTVTICQGNSAMILGNNETVAGIYSDTTTSSFGCDSITTQTLIVSSAHIFDLGNDTAICQGQNVVLDAGAGADFYRWVGGTTGYYFTQTWNVVHTGMYFVEARIGACWTYDTINVTVHPIITTYLPASEICQGDSALIFGNYETVAGNYYNTITASTGCDSILIQQLIVHPNYDISSTVNICQGDSAMILGNWENTSGVYSDTTVSAFGCDSITTQTLIVSNYPIVEIGNDTTLCPGQTLVLDAGAGADFYRWVGGTTGIYFVQTWNVNSPGMYFVEARNGVCWSYDTINVAYNPVITTVLSTDTICQGDSALIFGNYETTAGNYTTTITASTGCDSILQQTLIVNPVYNYSLATVNICSGDSALILGNFENVAGMYSDTFQTVNGCDSIINQSLNIFATPVVDLGNDTAICQGQSIVLDAGNSGATYQWQNGMTAPYFNQTFTATTTGMYYVLASIGTCSDRDTLNLTINPIITTNLSNVEICQGDSTMIFGNFESVAGTYSNTITASTGCDSILQQTLIVNPTFNQSLATVTICQGDSAMILGNFENTAGTYSDTLQSVNSCDSIVSQTLIVSPAPTVNLGNDTAICQGQNIVLDAGTGGTYQWMSGTTAPFFNQTFTVNSANNYYVVKSIGTCTVTDTIAVSINPIITTSLTNVEICQGDSTMIFGNFESVAGTYSNTITASTGCDSILQQTLIVNPTFNQSLATVTICQGDSAMILGNFENTAGTYSDTLQSVNSCDSIVSQTLIVSPAPTVNLGNDTAICQGQNLVLDAGTGGTYQWMSGTTAPFFNQTFTVNSANNYYVVKSIGTCTVTDTIAVSINPIITTSLTNVEICQGDSTMIFGNFESVAGTYSNTITASTGCDSILQQTLIVNSTFNQSLATVTICQGDSAMILGNFENTAGTYSDTLQSVNSCDSIVSQTLIVSPAPTVNLGNDTTICQGQSIVLDAGTGGTYQWMSGTTAPFFNQTFTVNSANNYYVVKSIGTCTVTDTIQVSINPIITTSLVNIEICQGDSTMIFGNFESVAGTYSNTITASTGCDSILQQTLIVNPVYTISQNTSICANDSILLGNAFQNTAGIYYDTLSSINGCDSIIVTTLNINPIFSISTTASICQGDSLLINGDFQTIAGTYIDTFTSQFGCDSIVSTSLIVYPIPVTILTPITICDNESVLVFGNQETNAGMYENIIANGSVNGCDSIVRQQLLVNPTFITNQNTTICESDSILLGGAFQNTSGMYYDSLQTALGCDSTIATQLTVVDEYVVHLFDTICAGDSVFVAGNFETQTGVYIETLQSNAGCDSIVTTSLTVNPLPQITVSASDTLLLEGQTTDLSAIGGTDYIWSPIDVLSCATCNNPTAKLFETTLFTVDVTENGCTNSDTIRIRVSSEFKIPQAFSPNGDGVNDVFEIVGISAFPEASITIINRWGSKVYEANPYKGDWDGTNYFGLLVGEKLPTGTYFYILDLGKKSPEGVQVYKEYIYINR